MESTAFFEKKISITPSEFNEVKTTSIESLLEKKSKEVMEKKCSEQGFVLSGTVKLLSRSMGYFESARYRLKIRQERRYLRRCRPLWRQRLQLLMA